MSQISPPIRILAVAAIALIALYMAVLRPKSSSVAPAPAPEPAGNVHTGKPAQTQFGKAVQAAQGAAKATEDQMKGEARAAGDTSQSDSAARSGSAPATTSSSSPSGSAGAATRPAVDVAGLPKPVARAVRRHKVLALLFWNGRSADDRAVHAALRKVERFDGAVYLHAAPLKTISSYGRITRGADVQQSPTVVVVDRKLRASTLVGYVDGDTIQQAVVDALRASGGIYTDPFLKRVNKVCSATAHDLYAIPQPTSLPQARRYLRRASERVDSFAAGVRATPAPRKWRSFKRATLADIGTINSAYRGLAHDLSGHPSLASVQTHFADAVARVGPAGKRFNRRMDRAGLIFCGSKN